MNNIGKGGRAPGVSSGRTGYLWIQQLVTCYKYSMVWIKSGSHLSSMEQLLIFNPDDLITGQWPGFLICESGCESLFMFPKEGLNCLTRHCV